MSVTTDPKARKAMPLCTGCLDYFPDALLAVAELSRIANEQHNPGQPMHWAKEKSTDEPDALLRHLIERGKIDTDGIRHSAKVAWRALALLQRELEARLEPTQAEREDVFRPEPATGGEDVEHLCGMECVMLNCQAKLRLDTGRGYRPMVVPNATDAAKQDGAAKLDKIRGRA